MYANKLSLLILLLLALVLTGCAVPSSPSLTDAPIGLARASTSPVPSPQATSTFEPAPTDAPAPMQVPPTPTALPTAVPSPTQTLTPTMSPTATVTPTIPPPLPLRDDLPPMTLKGWPRPADDNGLGLHFLATGYYEAADLDKQIARMQALHLKWAVVLYADENYLEMAAQKFKAAGIMVVWRKTLRPFQRYSSWGRDIEILNRVGMPPYMQLYNEPELPFEWEGNTINNPQFFANLFQAAKDVYNAGGYPGIQFLDEDNLREFITQIYARKGEALFHRMFFVAHSYGLNHPPNYDQDINGVLGFRTFAQIFQHRLGFIPPIIVGEGGWKIESAEDNRFPAIDDKLHRDYTLAVFDWFRTGKMSNGAPLPDYLFAFCHWMIAGAQEAGAWYDSFKGDRTLTIQAVQQLPPFVRKFSWDK